jgi:FAD/FMN-containing dehydrogenase
MSPGHLSPPPGVTAQDFADAVQEFEAAVGKEWVFTSEADVALYRDAYSPMWGEDDERVASAAVAPDGVEQVRAVMKIADARRIPVYPISTGRNLGYGGAAPVLSGSVVLDLKRMNRILEVSERNASALVEPGVSYFDLYRHIRQKKLKLWIDVPDPGWGSPLGNALERGAGYTLSPFRDHWGAHCGLEVVLPNGDLVRTGMGALPGAQTWQQFSYGYGPQVDGLFSQGSLGVVTKMGFWLLAEPEASRFGRVRVPRHDDLVPFVDTLAYLMNSGVMNSMTRLESPLLYGIVIGGAPDPGVQALLSKPGGARPEELEQYGVRQGIPYWSAPLQFYGPPKVVEAQWEYAKEKFSAAIPGATFEERPLVRFPLTDEQAAQMADPASYGIPSLLAFGMGARSPDNPTPSNGHVWFSPVIPMSAEEVFKCQDVFRKAFEEWGVQPLGVPLPQSYHPRTFTQIYGFPVTRDIATNRRNRETFRRMIKLAAEHGWGEYRTAPAFMDDCMAAYSFNDHALRRLHERLKDALDPNGILSAGRYGIWPRHLRGTTA